MSDHQSRTADFEHFVTHSLDVQGKSGDEWMCRCVFHDDSKASMQVNVTKGLFVCFTCGTGGKIEKIAKELGVRNFERPDPSIADIYEKLRLLDQPVEKIRTFNESYLDRFKFPTTYWEERGFKPETIKAFDLGYDMMNNYATIPNRDVNGEIIGVTKRFLDPDVPYRYKHPHKFKKSHNLFASWLVDQSDDDLVVVTEGQIDAMKVWQAGFPAVGQFGAGLSTTQIRLLRRLGVYRLVLFYDDDKAGRDAERRACGEVSHERKGRKVYEYREELDLRREFMVSVVEYTDSMPSDPGAMTKKQIKRAVAKAVRIT